MCPIKQRKLNIFLKKKRMSRWSRCRPDRHQRMRQNIETKKRNKLQNIFKPPYISCLLSSNLFGIVATSASRHRCVESRVVLKSLELVQRAPCFVPRTSFPVRRVPRPRWVAAPGIWVSERYFNCTRHIIWKRPESFCRKIALY